MKIDVDVDKVWLSFTEDGKEYGSHAIRAVAHPTDNYMTTATS